MNSDKTIKIPALIEIKYDFLFESGLPCKTKAAKSNIVAIVINIVVVIPALYKSDQGPQYSSISSS